jgi:ASC-1-like (ASCH) protein
MKSVLHLNLRRKYFAQIAAGTKHVEYREQTPYRKTRLEKRDYDLIKFRNGYATKAPEMFVEFCGVRKGRRKYDIRLGRILKIKRWKR